MKGDRVEVLVDVGQGVERFEIIATRAGRRVDISNVRGTVEVSEVTRSGRPVRSARFMASRMSFPPLRTALSRSRPLFTVPPSWPLRD